LRHTFGSWLALKGIPLRRIQYLMGHNSITTTERYTHLVQEEAYEDTRALEQMSTPFLLGSLLGGLDDDPASCYAEKRTRTSTGLRPLEPESSASANSAISAERNESMLLQMLKSIDCTDEPMKAARREVPLVR